MRITVDIEESVLDDLVKLTGETKRSPAVAKAVEDFVRRQKLREFGRLALHAARLEFAHPTDGRALCFDSPMPDDLRELLETLRAAA